MTEHVLTSLSSFSLLWGQRSGVNVKCFGVKGQGLMSNVLSTVVNTKDSTCQVQQKTITLKSQTKENHCQSLNFVCVFVIRHTVSWLSIYKSVCIILNTMYTLHFI